MKIKFHWKCLPCKLVISKQAREVFFFVKFENSYSQYSWHFENFLRHQFERWDSSCTNELISRKLKCEKLNFIDVQKEV